MIKTIIGDVKNHYSSYSSTEFNKGRKESRNIIISNNIDSISKEWKGLKQIVAVHRIVEKKGVKREETAYYITSKKEDASFYAEGTRNHWAIENSLHWVKDVTLKEDASKIVKGNAPQNMSTLKNIGINFFRKNNFEKIAQAMRLVANNIQLIYEMII